MYNQLNGNNQFTDSKESNHPLQIPFIPTTQEGMDELVEQFNAYCDEHSSDKDSAQYPRIAFIPNDPAEAEELVDMMNRCLDGSISASVESVDESTPAALDTAAPEAKPEITWFSNLNPAAHTDKLANGGNQLALNASNGQLSAIQQPIFPANHIIPQAPSLPQEKPKSEPRSVVTHYDTKEYLLRHSGLHFARLDGTIFCFDGKIYRPQTDESLRKLVVAFCRDYVKHVGHSGFPKGVVESLKDEPDIPDMRDCISSEYIAFNNGLLYLKSGELVPHTPDVVCTHQIRCNYLYPQNLPEHTSFDEFLFAIAGGDTNLVERVYQMIGYILSPDMGGKVFFILQGAPSSGKSLLCNLIKELFEPDAVSVLDIHELADRFVLGNAHQKALILSPDFAAGALNAKSASRLKQITGNDLVSDDVKYKDRVQFLCRAKVVIATNHPFTVSGSDDALYERAVVIPFEYTVPKAARDPNLLNRFKGELDAIASKAALAYMRLVRNHYEFAGSYALNSVTLGDNMPGLLEDQICDFVRRHVAPDFDGCVFTDDACTQFCELYRHVDVATFARHFYTFVEQRFPNCQTKLRQKKAVGANSQKVTHGIKLVP